MRWTTGRVIDNANPSSLSSKARKRRWLEFSRRFPEIGEMKVLDLGGTPGAWRMAPIRPAHVTTINLDAAQADEQWIDAVEGDACRLPGPVRRETFDLVFSNSLMEHVGGHVMRQRFAENVHSCAPRHWVQTPYRYFPIEPHWVFPAMQFLPYEIRVRISQGWHLGHMKTYTRAAAEHVVNEVELIGIAQMRTYFLESEIWRETFAGLIKSLVAVR